MNKTPWHRKQVADRLTPRAEVIRALTNGLLDFVRQTRRPVDTTLDEMTLSYLSALAMSAIYTDETNGEHEIRTQADLEDWLRGAIDRLVANKTVWNGIWSSCRRGVEI